MNKYIMLKKSGRLFQIFVAFSEYLNFSSFDSQVYDIKIQITKLKLWNNVKILLLNSEQ